MRAVENGRFAVDGIRRRLHRRMADRELRPSSRLARARRRLDEVDRTPPALLELPVAKTRLLQRGHLVDGHDLVSQYAADSGHRHPGHRLCAAAAAAALRAVCALAPGWQLALGHRS